MSLREKLLRVAPEAWEDEFVRIRPMATRDDLIYAGDGCRLTDEQREFVNPVWFSLGRAYLAPEDHDPCLIENERREPIGFLCFTAWADAYSWSYFLDVRQQGRGYGKRAAQLALRLLRLADPDMPVKLAVLFVANVLVLRYTLDNQELANLSLTRTSHALANKLL